MKHTYVIFGWSLLLLCGAKANIVMNIFRLQYGCLGVLRTVLPYTLIMVLSAILSPHMLHYTERVLTLKTPTGS